MLYKIFTTKGEEPLGITEKVNYIKISPTSGSYIGCDFEEAIGLAYNGTAYNLIGHSEIPNAEEAFAKEVDLGEVLDEMVSAKEMTKAYEEGVQSV